MLVPLHPENPNLRDLKKVIDCLNDDGVIILPTDTIYAMGCRLDKKKAIERMCRITGKKMEKVHFSLICSDLSTISSYTDGISKPVFRMMKSNLPGAFTFILPANQKLSKYFSGSKKTVGIRVPENAIAQELIRQLEIPLVVSTIHSGDITEYMTDPEEIHEQFKHLVDMVIDGGAGGNIPSTIIDCSANEPFVVREGKGVLV
jgi:tRNA threonylcarbamoyl adenosine modification protein (Sua5/YciO/YrdC/YwlC family)